jgi:hypothetical protein
VLRRIPGLFNECVKYHDPLTESETIERPSSAFRPTRPYLKKPLAHGSRVGHAQVWSKLHQEFNNSRIVGQNAIRPVFYFGFDPWVKVINGVWYRLKLAYLATCINRNILTPDGLTV